MESLVDILLEIPDGESLIIDSSPSLNQLIHTIFSNCDNLPQKFYLLYKRREKWYKIADNLTYQKIIKNAISSNQKRWK